MLPPAECGGCDDPRAIALPLDVTEPTQVANAVRDTLSRFGAIDLLVNNAGYGYPDAVEEVSEADIRSLFETTSWVLLR
jgi:NAD(P)-dependent dehydrogenase (short-subunit alcohol dehydrogenase family)